MALFSVAEARAFQHGGEKPLVSPADYLDADITAAEVRINERFREICGVAFESTSRTVTLDGNGRREIMLPDTKIISVSACSVNGVAITASDVKAYASGRLWRSIGWPVGVTPQNISVTYNHGYATVPAPIKRAALKVAVRELVGTNLPDNAIQQVGELGTFRLATPGGEGYWTGIPDVDATLRLYARRKALG